MVNPAGDFVVVWRSEIFAPNTGYRNIWARRFTWPIVPLDPLPVLVNSPIDADEDRPSVALDSESSLVVVWGAHPCTGGDTSRWSDAKLGAAPLR